MAVEEHFRKLNCGQIDIQGIRQSGRNTKIIKPFFNYDDEMSTSPESING